MRLHPAERRQSERGTVQGLPVDAVLLPILDPDLLYLLLGDNRTHNPLHLVGHAQGARPQVPRGDRLPQCRPRHREGGGNQAEDVRPAQIVHGEVQPAHPHQLEHRYHQSLQAEELVLCLRNYLPEYRALSSQYSLGAVRVAGRDGLRQSHRLD